MKQLTIENFKAMLDNALKNIKEREDEFSKLDAVIAVSNTHLTLPTILLV